MQINSNNSVAFGCGACAQAKKELKKLPGDADKAYVAFKRAVATQKEEAGITHGQSAVSMLGYVKKLVELSSRIKKP